MRDKIPTINSENLRRKVLEIYKNYLKGEDISEIANKIYLDYLGARAVLDPDLYEAINLLSAFTKWDKEIRNQTRLKKISKQRIKEMVKLLEKDP